MMKLLLLLAIAGICSADSVSTVKQNFADDTNNQIVQQITYELQASYLYQAYSHYFSRADVALPGFAKWFEKASKEERDHATGLIDYINKRGGSVALNDIQFSHACSTVAEGLQSTFSGRKVPCICYFMSQKKDKLKSDECSGDRSKWQSGLWAMQDTLALERFVNQQLLDLHKIADEDPHLSHILEHAYLDEQVDAIKQVGDYIRQLERVGQGLGEYLFDQNL